MQIKNLLRWLPALVVMGVIFLLSNTPARALPNFGVVDALVKKAGHMCGYGLLTIAYWYGLGFDPRKRWLALLLAVAYALTDEFHQSFIPGRHPSPVDVFLFDGMGGAIGLLLAGKIRSDRLGDRESKPGGNSARP